MKFLKRFFAFLALIGLFIYISPIRNSVSGYVNRWAKFSFCDIPISYQIGTIDPKYNLTENEVILLAKNAGKIWNTAFEKPLFVYSSTGDLTLNLVFDERQEILEKIDTTNTTIEQEKDLITINLEEYERQSAELENALTKLNEEINYWNDKGGAPLKKFDELNKKQKALQADISSLNAAAAQLNKSTAAFNSKIDDLNKQVNTFNSLLNTKPEEGLYTSGENKIDIFIYRNNNQFVHTTTHEFGHALGLSHLKDENSIMYPTSTGNLTLSELDIAQLNGFCQEHNKLVLIRNDIENLFYWYWTQLDR